MASREPTSSATGDSPPAEPEWRDAPSTPAELWFNRRNDPHRVTWCAGLYAAALTFATFLLFWFDEQFWLRTLIAEWPIWLLAAQLAGMSAIVRKFGAPSARSGWWGLFLANLWLALIAWLQLQELFEFAVYRSAEIALRLAVAAVWGFVILGFPVVVRWVWRRRRGVERRPSLVAKWWFSTTLVVVLVEPMAAILEQRQDRLSFPDDLAEPADDELRVAALGGSTMLGYPYEPKFGIPTVVKWRLQQMYPERTIVMQNLAVAGENLRQAIGRLHGLRVRPHVLLLYSGHNEFFQDLEELRPTSVGIVHLFDRWLFQSPTANLLNRRIEQATVLIDLKAGGRRQLFDHHIATPAVYLRRVERFRRQLEQLAMFCRDEGIAAVWFVPAGSESGYPPNRSHTPILVGPDIRNDLTQRFERARSYEADGQWSAAADLYRTGLERVPNFAEFHFRLAECLSQLGEFEAAARHYREALDQDGHPVRANRDYRRTVAEVAARFRIPIVDSPSLLRKHSPHGILGAAMFHDNVHPTLQAFFLLGIAACDRLAASGQLEAKFGRPQEMEPARLAEAVQASDLTVDDLAHGYRRLADTLRWLTRLRYDAARLQRQADRYENMARRLKAGEIAAGQGGSEALTGPTAGLRGRWDSK